MRKVILALLFILLTTQIAHAQSNNAPDYSVRVVNRTISVDGSILVLQFAVYNGGDASSLPATARLFLETGEEQLLDSQTVRPLGAQGDTEILTFNVELASIPSGNVDFRLEVGIGEVEAEDSSNIENNIARVGYIVPTLSAPRPTTPPRIGTPAVAPTATPLPPTPTATPSGIIPGLPFDLDLANLDRTNPLLIGGIIAGIGALLILLWVITIILRLLFRPPRLFEVWQPPYAAVPPHDPNTLAGRRQLWQHNAQSDTMNAPCIEGQYHIRKHLVGIDGKNLSGWRVRGIRLSQYDIYGRVARSQTLADSGTVKRLDRIARRSRQMRESDIRKHAHAIARRLVKNFLSKIHQRSSMLPIALDIRLRGSHGEVRINFELYQCVSGTLQQVDHWEPEMTVLSGAIQENYTYTLLGMRQGENKRAFRQRLEQNAEQTLYEMLHKASIPQEVSSDTSPSQPVQATAASTPASPTESMPPPLPPPAE
jgi:hypothetical protein